MDFWSQTLLSQLNTQCRRRSLFMVKHRRPQTTVFAMEDLRLARKTEVRFLTRESGSLSLMLE